MLSLFAFPLKIILIHFDKPSFILTLLLASLWISYSAFKQFNIEFPLDCDGRHQTQPTPKSMFPFLTLRGMFPPYLSQPTPTFNQ